MKGQRIDTGGQPRHIGRMQNSDNPTEDDLAWEAALAKASDTLWKKWGHIVFPEGLPGTGRKGKR